MDVRGFDSYDISLGDEMRGERASLGKSLEDVERDLRIKVKMLTAIEDCDLTGFNNQSVIAGYVRSYAKYLGMNADDCYARFCAESGYRSPAALMSSQGDGSGFGSMSSERPAARTAPIRGGVQIAESRFAAPPSRNRFQARISLGAVTSAIALIALIAGLSYGGWALLKDIQRIGFAPLHEAPTVAADPPEIATPIIMTGDTNKKPDASVYAGGGTLAAAADTPSDLTPGPRPRRDGPISAIDPRHASLFARKSPSAPSAYAVADTTPNAASSPARAELGTTPVAVATGPSIGANDTLASIPNVTTRTSAPEIKAPTTTTAATETATTVTGFALLAADEAWVEVKDRDDAVHFTGTMKAGQEATLPDKLLSPKVYAGNAGNTYIIVDGIAYGPLGNYGEVMRGFPLDRAHIRKNLRRIEDLAALRTKIASGGTIDIDVPAVVRADEKFIIPPSRPKR